MLILCLKSEIQDYLDLLMLMLMLMRVSFRNTGAKNSLRDRAIPVKIVEGGDTLRFRKEVMAAREPAVLRGLFLGQVMIHSQNLCRQLVTCIVLLSQFCGTLQLYKIISKAQPILPREGFSCIPRLVRCAYGCTIRMLLTSNQAKCAPPHHPCSASVCGQILNTCARKAATRWRSLMPFECLFVITNTTFPMFCFLNWVFEFTQAEAFWACSGSVMTVNMRVHTWQTVSVHVSTEDRMDFIKKNFLYRTLEFRQLVTRCEFRRFLCIHARAEYLTKSVVYSIRHALFLSLHLGQHAHIWGNGPDQHVHFHCVAFLLWSFVLVQMLSFGAKATYLPCGMFRFDEVKESCHSAFRHPRLLLPGILQTLRMPSVVFITCIWCIRSKLTLCIHSFTRRISHAIMQEEEKTNAVPVHRDIMKI